MNMMNTNTMKPLDYFTPAELAALPTYQLVKGPNMPTVFKLVQQKT